MKWWRMKERITITSLMKELGSLAVCREGCEKPFHEMMHEEGSDEVVENEGEYE